MKDNWNWFYYHRILWPLNDIRNKIAIWIAPTIVGFMCKVDAECELGGAMGGNRVYPTEADLRRNAKCVDECGIRKVHIILGEVVQEGNYWSDDEEKTL